MLLINNKTPKSIFFKGMKVSKVIYKNICVWMDKILSQITGTSSVQLEASSGEALDNYKICGNSVQDGNPEPESPIEIKSVGETTINLYDVGDLYIPVKAGEYYQIEYPTEAEAFFKTIRLYDSNKTLVVTAINYSYKGAYLKWIVKPQSDGYLLAYVDKSQGVPHEDIQLMITKGLTVTLTSDQITNLEDNSYTRVSNTSTFPEYVPKYKIPITINGVTTDIYLTAPLRKVGNYCDYIDFKEGVVVRHVKRIDASTIKTWTYNAGKLFFMANAIAETPGMIVGNKMSTHFEMKNIWTLGTEDTVTTGLYENTSFLTIRYPKYNKVADFKNWLASQTAAGTPVYVDYGVVDGVVETIDLPQLLTEEGENTINIGTEIAPSSFIVDYWKQ